MRRALVAAVALMLIVPALAPAKSPNVQRADDRAPSARVQTTGSGLITVSGRLSVNGLIPERGIVVVRDRRGDARAHLAGVPLSWSGAGDPGAPGVRDPVRHRLERDGHDHRATSSRSRSPGTAGRLFGGSGVYRAQFRARGRVVRRVDPHRPLLLRGEKESSGMRKLLLIGGAAALIALPAVALADDRRAGRRDRPRGRGGRGHHDDRQGAPRGGHRRIPLRGLRRASSSRRRGVVKVQRPLAREGPRQDRPRLRRRRKTSKDGLLDPLHRRRAP